MITKLCFIAISNAIDDWVDFLCTRKGGNSARLPFRKFNVIYRDRRIYAGKIQISILFSKLSSFNSAGEMENNSA